MIDRPFIGCALLMAVLGAAMPAWGQDLGLKAPAQKNPLIIQHAVIHPVSGPALEDASLRCEAGRITAIGRIEPQGGEDIIDARGHHLYPGLIAPWTQLGLTEFGEVRQSQDFNETGDFSPEVRAGVAVNPDSTLLPVTRANGVLLATVHPSGGILPGRTTVIRLDGWTADDLAVTDAGGLVIEWPGARRRFGFAPPGGEDDPGREANSAVTRLDEFFRTARAAIQAQAADPRVPTDIRCTALGRCWATTAAPALPIFVQADDQAQITAAVAFALRHDVKIVIVGGREAPACAELLKDHRVPVIIAGTLRLPRRNDSDYDESLALPGRLEALGIEWCLGSGEETPHERNLPYSAGMAVAHGLAHDAALRSLTLSTARILGIADRYGSLDNGKSATMIMTDGDPLEIMTHVERAWIDGREIDLASKHTRLAEKYRAKYRQLGLLPPK